MSGFFEQPYGSMPKIESIWAFLAVDPKDGCEGVISTLTPLGPMPMITADRVRLDQYTAIAKAIGAASGVTIRLVKFETRTVIQTIEAQ